LNLEDVQTATGLLTVLVFVTLRPANSLVAARAERPTAVFWRRTVPSQQHHANLGILGCVQENSIEFVYGLWSKGIADFWTIERHSHDPERNVTVIGDVFKCRELRHLAPSAGIENLGN
jgi:hypothetical protein